MIDSGNEVLDLRQLFAAPWEGEGSVWLPPWVRWVPVPRSFRFRSEIANLAGETWDVVDTTTYPDDKAEQRRMRARQVSPTEIVVDADDMPGGARLHLRHDGFEFKPYRLRVRFLGPLRATFRFYDRVELTDGRKTLIDSIVREDAKL